MIFGNDNDSYTRRLSCFYCSDLTGCERTRSFDKMWRHGVCQWKSTVCSKVNHAENDQKIYMKAIAVPKNILPSACCAVKLGTSLAIPENLTTPLSWWSSRLTRTPQWRALVSESLNQVFTSRVTSKKKTFFALNQKEKIRLSRQENFTNLGTLGGVLSWLTRMTETHTNEQDLVLCWID